MFRFVFLLLVGFNFVYAVWVNPADKPACASDDLTDWSSDIHVFDYDGPDPSPCDQDFFAASAKSFFSDPFVRVVDVGSLSTGGYKNDDGSKYATCDLNMKIRKYKCSSTCDVPLDINHSIYTLDRV